MDVKKNRLFGVEKKFKTLPMPLLAFLPSSAFRSDFHSK